MANADVFNLLPEVPVIERWEFLTDELTNYKGTTARLALRHTPRVYQSWRVGAMTLANRAKTNMTLSQAIRGAYNTAFFQYSAPLTAAASSAQARVFFDPSLTNIRAQQGCILYNVRTQATELFTVLTVEVDGATFTTNLANNQDAGFVVALPAPLMNLTDGAETTFGGNAGELSVKFVPLEMWDLIRPNSSISLDQFDSLYILNETILDQTTESWLFRRELLDNQVGKISTRTRNDFSRESRTVTFEAIRSTAGLDFWRTFFNTIRGAQTSFLLSTQLSDLTLSGAHSIGFTVDINEAAYSTVLGLSDAFSRVKIDYSDAVSTNHTIASATPTTITLGETTTSVNISRISFLHRVRASDTIRLRHFQDRTRVSFSVETAEQ